MRTKIRSRVLYWDFFSEMAKKHNVDVRIIEAVCLSPFKFLNNAIKEDNDLKPIMMAYLGKFKLKKQFEENKNKDWK